jgi:IclR family KDG regulon transcriptional repressor
VTRAEGRYTVGPVARAMLVLQCVGASPEPISLKAICSDVRLPKTTVYRYLATLCASGVVHHDSQRALYTIDVGMLSMIRLGAGLRRLRDVCLPHMQQLADDFGETINLGVLDGIDVVYVEILEGRRAPKMQARVGGRDPNHATALGRAMLAFLPEAAWTDLIPPRLRKITTHTLDSVPGLLADLEMVKRRGYAEEVGESEADAACVAVPIRGGYGEVVAGLSLSAPAVRMTGPRPETIAAALTDATRKIGLTLAFERETAGP